MITQKEYAKRRKKLLKKMSNNSVGVMFSAEYKVRSNDTHYPYRQNSNFYYMSGFKEDKSALLFIKNNKKTKVILFVAKKDKKLELWNGKRLGEKKAKKLFLVDEVCCIDELEKRLKESLEDSRELYFDFKLDYSKVKILKRYAKKLSTHKNIAPLIQKMRLIKSPAEIKLIKKAISITKKAHKQVQQMDKTDKNEYELLAELEYVFKKNGAYSDAYTSIVASGNSANTLHYIDNNKPLKNGDLILVDAGCEYEYYASDLTRTVSVNGKFTKAQKKLYNLVLNTQIKVIKMIKPQVKRSDLQKYAVKLLTKGMVKLKILRGDVKRLIKDKAYERYYPHNIGHWMGLDVHDEAPYKDKNNKEIPLQKGMILTIEPGIYIDKNDKSVPKKYRGIGIRIEDNILVTKNGYKKL
jgi:Xaa-Pro aminopeptidase